MKTVEAQEAQAHFSELLAEVAGGESVEIRDNGIIVARIVPVEQDYADFDFADAAAAIKEWEQYRDEHHIRLGGGITIRELIEEGRR